MSGIAGHRGLMLIGRIGRPLDGKTDGLWAACGLQRLLTAYSGPLVRVRRSSDNVEQDIDAGIDDAIDQSALLAFAGAGSAYVTVLYDQSGNGNDASQATAGLQPRIMDSGAFDGALRFDGEDDRLVTSASTVSSQAMTWHLRGSLRSTGADQIIVEHSANYNNNEAAILYWQSLNSRLVVGSRSASQTPGRLSISEFDASPTAAAVFTPRIDRSKTSGAAQAVLFVDGVLESRVGSGGETSFAPSTNLAAQPITIGARSSGASPASLDLSMLAIYLVAQSDDDVAKVANAFGLWAP